MKSLVLAGGTAFPGCARLTCFLDTGWKACATELKNFSVSSQPRPGMVKTIPPGYFTALNSILTPQGGEEVAIRLLKNRLFSS